MPSLDLSVRTAVREALGEQVDVNDIYNEAEWRSLRDAYATRKDWYDGVEWKRLMDGRDSVTGEKQLQWPLQINPIARFCRIHRAVMLGMQQEIVGQSPVTTIVPRVNLQSDDEKKRALVAERFVSDTWYWNKGTSILFEQCLTEQFYGGSVFQVAWEPYSTHLPNRIAIRAFKSPAFFYPVAYQPYNEWELLEAYIGYMIPAATARLLYAIVPEDSDAKEVLYLEHWTTENYRVTVDGKVPKRKVGDKTYPLEGENKWKRVPIVYIPHERDGEYYGRSLVDDDCPLIGMSKELNARMADKGDVVQDAKPVAYVSDTGNSGFTVRRAEINGRVMEILDIGDKSAMPNSGAPKASYLETNGLPQSVSGYDQEIRDELRHQADISAVAVGDDDVSGGRITGPVTAYRMWPTIQHTFAERAFFSMGLQQIASLIMTIASERASSDTGYAAHKLPAPELDIAVSEIPFSVAWKPMIPIEVSQRMEMYNERLRAGGISLRTYLEELGVQDVVGEEERIWKDRERTAVLEKMTMARETPTEDKPEEDIENGEQVRDETGQ